MNARALFLSLTLVAIGCSWPAAPGPSPSPTPFTFATDSPEPTATPSAALSSPPTAAPSAATIARAVDIGKSQGPFDPAEIAALAKFSYVAVNVVGGYSSDPAGVQGTCAQIHAINAAAQCTQYWGFSGNGHRAYSFYSDPQFQTSWWIVPGSEASPVPCPQATGDTTQCELNYNLQAERDLWTTYAASYACAPSVNGALIDGAANSPGQNGTPLNKSKIALFSEFRAKVNACGGSRTIAINGDAANLQASGFAPFVDIVMIEPVDLWTGTKPKTPDQNKGYLTSCWTIMQAGKICDLKLWPYPESWLADGKNAKPPAAPAPYPSGWFSDWPYGAQLAYARQAAIFDVAECLIDYDPHELCDYGWGYGETGGQVPIVASQPSPAPSASAWPTLSTKTWKTWTPDVDYAPFHVNVGASLGPPSWVGYVGTHRFAAGTVTLDYLHHTASVPGL